MSTPERPQRPRTLGTRDLAQLLLAAELVRLLVLAAVLIAVVSTHAH